MVLMQFFGAIGLATGTILERMVLKKKAIKVQQFQVLSFFTITLIMIPFLFFFWKLDSQALQLKNILVLLAIVGFSLLANYFTFTSMKGQKLSKLEPAKMMEPLFVIFLVLLFSFIIGPIYERNFLVMIPALIAGLALVFSHIEKHHFKFGKYFVYAIIGSFFFALEMVLSKLILEYYSPITLYFVRCFLILITIYLIFRPKVLEGLDKDSKWKILLSGFIWVALRIIIYVGYESIGIVKTTLMIMLGPVFIYLFAWKFLKEKPTWKNLVASGVIILCVIYAAFIQ